MRKTTNLDRLTFNPIEVTGERIARAAMRYIGSSYSIVNPPYHPENPPKSANCYGLLLFAAIDLGLLYDDFPPNLDHNIFGQGQAQTLWDIIDLNFVEVPKSEMKVGDLLLLVYGDTHPKNRREHHVALVAPAKVGFQHEGYSWLVDSINPNGVRHVVIDALMQQRITSVRRLKSLME
jgi:hypothetical protein